MISNMQSRPVKKVEDHSLEGNFEDVAPLKHKATTVTGNAPKRAKSTTSSKSDGSSKPQPVHSNSAPTLTSFFKTSSESGVQMGKFAGKSSLSSFLNQYRHKQPEAPEPDRDEVKPAESMTQLDTTSEAAVEAEDVAAAPIETSSAPKKPEDRE